MHNLEISGADLPTLSLNEVNKNGVHSEFDNGLLMVY